MRATPMIQLDAQTARPLRAQARLERAGNNALYTLKATEQVPSQKAPFCPSSPPKFAAAVRSPSFPTPTRARPR